MTLKEQYLIFNYHRRVLFALSSKVIRLRAKRLRLTFRSRNKHKHKHKNKQWCYLGDPQRKRLVRHCIPGWSSSWSPAASPPSLCKPARSALVVVVNGCSVLLVLLLFRESVYYWLSENRYSLLLLTFTMMMMMIMMRPTTIKSKLSSSWNAKNVKYVPKYLNHSMKKKLFINSIAVNKLRLENNQSWDVKTLVQQKKKN